MLGSAARVLRWLTKWLDGNLLARAAQASAAGRHADAAQLLMRAARAQPGDAEVHYELGRTMRALGEPARAVTCFREALRVDAAHADAAADLAGTLLGLGQPQAAETHARQALAAAPRSLAAHVNLGAALEGQGRFAEAAARYRAALDVDPACSAALLNLSAVCLQLGRVEEAHDAAARALELKPGDFQARQRLASALLEQGRAPQAAEELRRALAADPQSAAAHNSLGHALDMLGRAGEARAHYERALALEPDNVQAHVNLASLLLLDGDYARGWDEYEWRLRDAERAALHERFGLPLWDGSPPAGRTLIVYAEQGVGDEIMYASCLPDLHARGARCVVDCDPRLAGLFQRSFPQALIHGGRQTDPADWLAAAGGADWRVPCASLARHLRRSPEAFAAARAGYLHADPARIARWHGRVAALGAGRKVGLSWRGGVAATGRGARSIPLAELEPLLRTPGTSFVSLQYGDCAAELEAAQRRFGVTLHHWPEAIADFDEMAALVCALDLTVSVCTALVHLGGALGRPVWVMAPLRPEPRYGRSGPRMPWYASVRMFRQRAYGEWRPAVEEVAAALAA